MPFTPPEVKGPTPREVWQLIKEENLFETLDLDPKYVRHLYISNLITRTLARVVGQGPYGAVPIRCNQDGYLYVAGLGGGYTRNVTVTGTAGNSWSSPIDLGHDCGRIDLYVFDNKIDFQRSRDGVTWDDAWEVFKDSMLSLDVVTRQLKIKNHTSGAVARYQIVGYFAA